MKQIYILIAFSLISVNIYAQCSFDSNDTGSITNSNFSSTSSVLNLNSQFGQSFTACSNGTLNTIGILSISANSGITITVYEGAGNTGTNLGSVASLSTTAATSIDDRSLLDMSSASISLTAGQVYTFYATSGQVDSRISNVSIYADGDAYSNNTLSNVNDFLFSVDITSGTLSNSEITGNNKTYVYPNPSKDTIELSELTESKNYVIYNTLGKKVKNGIISNNEQIDIKDFTNGLYFLKFDNGTTIKFIKE